MPPKGIINFNQVLIEKEFQDKKMQFSLTIAGSDRVFYFKTKDPTHYVDWKKALINNIDNSVGKFKNLTLDSYKQYSKSFKFWRFIRLSEEEFLDQVQVCDLLLCIRKNTKDTPGAHKIHDVYSIIVL